MIRPILLLGATGFTGELTCQSLAARGLPFIAAGRRADRLSALSQRLGGQLSTLVVDVASADSLEAALDAFPGAVVSCAGPFIALGEAVVEACVARGIPYLDCTGEQAFMARAAKRFDRLSREAGAPVVNAFAFEYAPGDWMSAAVAERLGGLDSLELYYRLDSPLISRGTYLSMKLQAEAPSVAWEGGAPAPRAMASMLRRYTFPGDDSPTRLIFVPFGEVLTVPRHVSVAEVLTFMSVPRRSASLEPLKDQEKRADGLPFGPGDDERRQATFAIAAVGRRGDETATLILNASDPYGLTAALLALGAERAALGSMGGGVLAPSQALPAAEGLAWLEAGWGATLSWHG